MLLQIPHLPHSKVLDFGALPRSRPVAATKAKGAAKNEKSGDREEEENEVTQGAVPLVGSAFPSTDKFTGSGATTTERPLEQTVRRAGEGLIGKLRVRASGKVELMLGDIPLRVIDGPECASYQELVYLQAQERFEEDQVEEASGAAASAPREMASDTIPLAEWPTVCFLGPIENRVTVVPDIAWLLKKRL